MILGMTFLSVDNGAQSNFYSFGPAFKRGQWGMLTDFRAVALPYKGCNFIPSLLAITVFSKATG